MLDFTNEGRFIKQFLINFSDGTELHAWIYMSPEGKLRYGHNLKNSGGHGESYLSSEERDFFELADLDRKVTLYMSMLAVRAKANMKIIEFDGECGISQQIQAMEEDGLNTKNSLKIKDREDEIRKLDELWNRSEKKMEEEQSSLDWLMARIEEWEKANKSKGRIVEFFGCFFSVEEKDKNYNMQDRIFAYGMKKTILGSLKEMEKAMKKEKSEVINW